MSLDRDRALYPYASLYRGGCNSLSASDAFERMYLANYVFVVVGCCFERF